MIIQRRVALQPSDVARCVEQTDLGDLPCESNFYLGFWRFAV